MLDGSAQKEEGGDSIIGKYVQGDSAQATPNGSAGKREGVAVSRNEKKKTITVVNVGPHSYDHGALKPPVYSRPEDIHDDGNVIILPDPADKAKYIGDIRKTLNGEQK
jgi:hypothetical protein